MAMQDRADIVTIRLPDGREISLGDWSDVPRYSTVDLLGGFTDTQIVLFQYASGDEVVSSDNVTIKREATQLDTNMEKQGGMASSEELLIYSIKNEVFQLVTGEDEGDATAWSAAGFGLPVPEPTVLGVLHLKLVVTLLITEKPYSQAGFGYFNAGFGPFIAAGANGGFAGTARYFANQGVPGAHAVRPYAVPHHVAGTENLELLFENPSGDAVDFFDTEGSAITPGIRVRSYIDGLYRRPVG